MLDQIDLLSIAKPYLKDLSEKTGETVHLVEREEINAIQKQNQVSFLLKVNLKLYVFSEDDNRYAEAELRQ